MIRWLGAEDLPQWREIRAEALRLNPTAFLTTLEEFLAESDRSVAQKLARGKVLARFDGASIVAVAAYNRMDGKSQSRHRAEIGAVYVRPVARGTGVATELMEYLAARATSTGVTQLELYVERSNTAALKFYEKMGYEKFGTLPNAAMIDGVANDDFFMVRLLDR